MLSAIGLELMKWKRSKILLSAVIAAFVAPFITLVSTSLKTSNLGLQAEWVDIIALCMQVNHLFVFPLTFSALAAFIFVQEYQTGAVINLFTLPVSRKSIILAKTITLLLTLMVLNLLSYVLTILVGKVFIAASPWAAFVRFFPLALKTCFMQFSLMPIFICIGLWTRHFVPPLITAGAFIMIDFISLAMPSIGPFLFPALPYYVILQEIGWYPTGIRGIPYTWELLVPVFFIFLITALVISEKQDI